MTRAEYWEAVWHVMGDVKPCANWRLYLETYENIREALAGALAGEHRGEGALDDDAHLRRFPRDGVSGTFAAKLRNRDAEVARCWLGDRTGLLDGHPDDYLAELLARWPELAALDGGGE